MADKSFGVKDINLIGASGTPTIDSPNNLNINAVNVAISTDITVAGKVSLGTGTSISSPAANTLTLGTNNAESLRVTSDGDVGIGDNAPDSTYGTNLSVHSTASDGARLKISDGASGKGNNDGFDLISTSREAFLINRENADMSFSTNNTTRLRLAADGSIGTKGLTPSDGSFCVNSTIRSQNSSSNISYMGFTGYTGNSTVGDMYSYMGGDGRNTGYLNFSTNDTERLRIDSSGRVGINTNTFNDAAEALRVQAPSGQSNTHLTIKAGSTSGYGVLNFGDDDFNEGRIKYDHSSNTMEFFADDTGFMKYEDDSTGGRFSLTSNGTYLTANTVDYYINAGSTRTYGVYVHKNNTGGTYGLYSYTLGGNSTQYSIGGQADTSSTYSSGGGLFYSINSNTYGIVGYWSGSAYYTIYGNGVSLCTGGHTTSDARLKDVQSGIGTGILDKVCSLEAKKYTWKENTQQRRSVGVGTQIGLLAQDVLEHFPEVVMEHENPEIAGHNPETLNEQIGTTYSIDYGKMTAVLIEAIKDLKAENNALAARVAALEAS